MLHHPNTHLAHSDSPFEMCASFTLTDTEETPTEPRSEDGSFVSQTSRPERSRQMSRRPSLGDLNIISHALRPAQVDYDVLLQSLTKYDSYKINGEDSKIHLEMRELRAQGKSFRIWCEIIYLVLTVVFRPGLKPQPHPPLPTLLLNAHLLLSLSDSIRVPTRKEPRPRPRRPLDFLSCHRVRDAYIYSGGLSPRLDRVQ